MTTYNTEPIKKDLGPCVVVYKTVVIGKTATNPEGGTHGGVIANYTVSGTPTFRDAEGGNPHDKIITEHMASVTAKFAGLSLEQVKVLLPNAAWDGAGAGRKLLIKNPVGISERENAGPLILKPIESGVVSTDPTEWLIYPLSFAIPKFALPFDLKTQSIFEVEFDIFNDLTTDVIAEWSYSEAT